MNYKKIYDTLIEKARTRELDSQYYEKHHIVPRCQGGTDEPSNLVKLTPEEHYVAHQLLAKAHPTHRGLMHAALMMCVNRPSNKLYGWIRRRVSESQSLKMLSESPTKDKRWISNETETIFIDKHLAAQAIDEGTHIAGKRAVRADCGHLVRDRCIPCEDNKRKALAQRSEDAKVMARELFEEFKNSSATSVCEFAKVKGTSQPRLSMLWKKHIPEYNSQRRHGKSFKE